MKKHEIEEQLELLIKVTRGPVRQSLQQALLHLTTPKHVGLTASQCIGHTAGKLHDSRCPGLYLEAAPRLGRIWRIRSQKDGDKIITIGTYPDMSLGEAREAWRGHRAGTLTIKPPPANVSRKRPQRTSAGLTLGELSDKYVAFSKKHKAKSTAATDERAFRQLMDIVGDIKVGQLTEPVLRDALIEIALEHPRTADLTQGTIRHAWKVGQGRDKRQLMKSTDLWISTSIPCPSPNMSFTKSKQRYAMDDKELEAYVSNLYRSKIPQVVQDVLEFQLHLGARIGEVCAIQTAWVREELDYIELPASATKNGTSHRFYLTERIRNLVKDHLDRDEKFLFRRDDDGNPFNSSRIQHLLAANREELGIERQDDRDDIGTHTARRTARTFWKSAGVPFEVRERLSNHKPQGIGSRYDWGADLWPQAREALERWSDHLTGLGWM